MKLDLISKQGKVIRNLIIITSNTTLKNIVRCFIVGDYNVYGSRMLHINAVNSSGAKIIDRHK
jgi:hypothetical protein